SPCAWPHHREPAALRQVDSSISDHDFRRPRLDPHFRVIPFVLPDKIRIVPDVPAVTNNPVPERSEIDAHMTFSDPVNKCLVNTTSCSGNFALINKRLCLLGPHLVEERIAKIFYETLPTSCR